MGPSVAPSPLRGGAMEGGRHAAGGEWRVRGEFKLKLKFR